MKRGLMVNIIVAVVIAIIAIIGVVSILVASYAAIVGTSHVSSAYFLGYKPIIVVTGSMEPAIKVNSLSIVKKCSMDDVNVGDIIMYKSSSDIMVTHRVISITEVEGEKAVITKGDANEYQDIMPVDKNMLEAKVVYTANYMVPIISEIMPEPGIINMMALVRAVAIVIVITAVIGVIIATIGEVLVHIYWLYTGENKYDAILQEYYKNIQLNLEAYNRIIQDVHKDEYKFYLIDKIKVAIWRAKLIDNFDDIKKSTKKIQKRALKYHEVYNKALVRGAIRQQKIVEKLKNKHRVLSNILENEERIKEDLSEAVKIDELCKDIFNKQLNVGNTDSNDLSTAK